LQHDRIMIILSIEEPVFETRGGLIAETFEEGKTGMIVGSHADMELVQVKHMEGIVGKLCHSLAGIAFLTVLVEYDQPHLSTPV